MKAVKFGSRILVMFVLSLLFAAVPAQAATLEKGIVSFSLETNADSYEGADVTGDGKKDLVEWIQSEDYSSYTLKINGETIKIWNQNAWANIVLIKNKGYLAIGTEIADGKTTWGLYKVDKGQLSCVYKGQNAIDKKILAKSGFCYYADGYDMFTPIKVSGNVLYADLMVATKSLGQIKVKGLKLVLKNGKFTLDKAAGKASARLLIKNKGPKEAGFKAKKSFKVYKKAGSSKKVGTVKKKAEFSISKAAIIKKQLYVYVKAGKTKGWVKLTKKTMVKQKGALVWG